MKDPLIWGNLGIDKIHMETKYGTCSECHNMKYVTLIDERWLCNECVMKMMEYFNSYGSDDDF